MQLCPCWCRSMTRTSMCTTANRLHKHPCMQLSYHSNPILHWWMLLSNWSINRCVRHFTSVNVHAGECVLETPHNPISVGLTLTNLLPPADRNEAVSSRVSSTAERGPSYLGSMLYSRSSCASHTTDSSAKTLFKNLRMLLVYHSTKTLAEALSLDCIRMQVCFWGSSGSARQGTNRGRLNFCRLWRSHFGVRHLLFTQWHCECCSHRPGIAGA